jgi:gamma-glutamyl phosphate reductase
MVDDEASVPTIEYRTPGVCHVYIDEYADLGKATSYPYSTP